MADLKASCRRFYDEVMSQGNLDLIDELVADDFVEHETMPGVPPGKDSPREMTKIFRTAFPDLRAVVEEMVQEGNKVAVLARFTGTHQGDFMGIPPTGKSVDVPVFDLIEFRGDKVIAHWGVSDNGAMMEQLGLVDMPG